MNLRTGQWIVATAMTAAIVSVAAGQSPAPSAKTAAPIVQAGAAMADSADKPLPARKESDVEGRSIKKDGGASSAGDWLRTVLALAVVAGILYGLRFVLRRHVRSDEAKSASGPLEVLWRMNLAPKHQALLVRMGERLLLVGISPGGMTTLAEATNANEIAALTAATQRGDAGSFAGLLGRKKAEFDRAAQAAPGGEAKRLAEKLRACQSQEDRP
jgi:flagellar protein FliO/FliZ